MMVMITIIKDVGIADKARDGVEIEEGGFPFVLRGFLLSGYICFLSDQR